MDRKTETRLHGYAWKIFLGVSVLIAFFGVGDVLGGGATFVDGESVLFQRLTGTTWADLQATDPGAANLIDWQVRASGTNLLIMGILMVAVSFTGFRKGDRWAWYAMWVWPLWTILAILLLSSAATQPGPGTPIPILSGSVLLVISLVALAMSYRKFFPGQGQERAHPA